MIKVDVSNVISEAELAKYQDKVNQINEMINKKTGAGNDFLGWVDWPENYDREELERLLKDAKYVRENFYVLSHLVITITQERMSSLSHFIDEEIESMRDNVT